MTKKVVLFACRPCPPRSYMYTDGRITYVGLQIFSDRCNAGGFEPSRTTTMQLSSITTTESIDFTEDATGEGKPTEETTEVTSEESIEDTTADTTTSATTDGFAQATTDFIESTASVSYNAEDVQPAEPEFTPVTSMKYEIRWKCYITMTVNIT